MHNGTSFSFWFIPGSEMHIQTKGWNSAFRTIYMEKQFEIDKVSLKLEPYLIQLQLWKYYQTIPDKITQILISEPHIRAK